MAGLQFGVDDIEVYHLAWTLRRVSELARELYHSLCTVRKNKMQSHENHGSSRILMLGASVLDAFAKLWDTTANASANDRLYAALEQICCATGFWEIFLAAFDIYGVVNPENGGWNDAHVGLTTKGG